MAVIVKYIVVRNGEEKMTFATKKEADAYDKMLDIADRLFDFLGEASLELDEARKEEISLLIAQRRDEVMPILRGIKPKKKTAPKPSATKPVPKPAAKSGAKSSSKTAKPKMAAKKK